MRPYLYLRCAAVLLAACCSIPFAAAEWQQDANTLAWRNAGQEVWRFSFDPSKGKTFFHPITAGGPSLTNFKPEDHPWHYGLWFSWKYINHVNYWEEDRKSGKAEGATRWNPPRIETRPDGSATVHLEIAYMHPSGRTDLSESRDLSISAPGPDGSYMIDWRAHFVAGSEGAKLDRTEMPGEPNGQVNGGYAGLGIRMANNPLSIAFVTTEGPITAFSHDRARPAAPAVACNFSEGGHDAGSIAVLSDPVNAGEPAPWYLINSAQMRFVCAAILAPRPRTIPPGGVFDLRYRISLKHAPWTPEALQAAWKDWQSPTAAAAGR